ncbi:SDR family oxidoreductase [Geomonas sp. RF6]|uniref:SDR family NAD(P)-dependent oxidoreductase n=1 Tax=Geomonas sp. RF6 TaxID=2897342 RepID=UPI001E2DE76F|nr:SDR family oxidoreductase [Geomonas sp. RF6]UFS71917.1 SDR family oxidoreductase [Geomonas sp. RF6]
MKIALVTGGSRGLGKNMCLHLAAKGTDIILTYHSNEEQAREVVAEIERNGGRGVALQLDVSDHKSFEPFRDRVAGALSEMWGRSDFDFLVNNAGTGVYAPIAETTEEQFDRMVNIHYKSVFFLTQMLLPLIKDGGRIVNISSGLARFSLPGYAAYASAKGAVEVFTRYLAVELGARGITVNVVAPGAIETDFGGGVVRDNPELNKAIAAQTPLGRVGLPDDIGGAVAALLSDDCRWINGQRIEVSGGIHL